MVRHLARAALPADVADVFPFRERKALGWRLRGSEKACHHAKDLVQRDRPRLTDDLVHRADWLPQAHDPFEQPTALFRLRQSVGHRSRERQRRLYFH